MLLGVLTLLSAAPLILCLDNGVILTPPMGWLTWERFRCNTDCKNDPDNCIGENLIKTMANIMVKEGYRDAGYEYINIDDCWPSKQRDAQMRLQADPDRFPSGMKNLSDYVHKMGLKLGIYEDFGTKTCAGFPGSEYFMQTDAQTFADWGIDYVKFDTCNSIPEQYAEEFPPMAMWLNMTGRHMALSCEYPLYIGASKLKMDFYERLSQACNLARNFADMQDSWDSVANTIKFYSKDIGNFSKVARPGYFNDPDELIIGDFGLSYDQQRVQMGMWAIMASPLIMSADLRNIRADSKALLQNKGAISINQDPLGLQGRMIKEMGNLQIWTKPISPKGSYAFAFVNFDTGGTPSKVSMDIREMGLVNPGGYTFTEAFDNMAVGKLKPGQHLDVWVNPTGIYLGKAIAM